MNDSLMLVVEISDNFEALNNSARPFVAVSPSSSASAPRPGSISATTTSLLVRVCKPAAMLTARVVVPSQPRAANTPITKPSLPLFVKGAAPFFSLALANKALTRACNSEGWVGLVR